MGRITFIVAALALLVVAGCSSVVPGQAAPSGGSSAGGPAAPGAGGPFGSGGAAPGDGASAGGSGGGLCDTLSPAQLAEVGLAGAVSESIDGPVQACHWSVPGTFNPVALMRYPNTDLQAISAAAGGAAVQYQPTQVAGLPAIEGGVPAGGGVCGVMVAVGSDVVSLVAPGSCDQVRQMIEMVIPNLPS